MGEVDEAVEGELDLVAEFVGTSYDSIEKFANLDGRWGECFA